MELLECILTRNDCYQAKQTIVPKGVMVHSTGANNTALARYVQPAEGDADFDALLTRLGTNHNKNDWNRAGLDVCVHGFIGRLADGSVASVQTLPWDRRGWHAGTGTGGGSANDTHISFEICEDGLTDPDYFGLVYREAVELTAYLCRQYGLDPLADGVVICHSEGYRRGIASDHADVEHWFPGHGKSMDDFRADTAAALAPSPEPEKEDDMIWYRTLDEIPEYYRPTMEKLMKTGVLKGYSNPDPDSLEDNVLNVSEDFCRILTLLDQLGKLD